jgi:alpha-galactosidase
MKTLSLGSAGVLWILLPQLAAAAAPNAAEMAEARRWTATNFEATPDAKGVEPFFSFNYGGKPSRELLGAWELKRAVRKLDEQRTEHALAWTDPKTGLVVRCVGLEYRDFPTIEWTLYFKNTGQKDTPILERIQALDIKLERRQKGEFALHHQTGDTCSATSYEPHQVRLDAKSDRGFAAGGGRPTNGRFPYFNIEYDGGGVLAVIGWPGQWTARFTRDEASHLHITGGQELTHFKLLPGEEVRSPLVVLQFWKGGDWIRAQNVWRRWMWAHNVPRPGGKPPQPLLSAGNSGFFSFTGMTQQNQIEYIDVACAEKLGIDCWWMDAGWYPNKTGWWNIGTWEPDAKRFPDGLRKVSDHAHAKGIKVIVWFEPERVTAGTWLADNRPEWIHGGKNGGLLNLGNPAAWNWLVNHINKVLTGQGIDLYRQDFNMDPLGSWRGADAPDRQGITEIRHVTGYLAYWDELHRRHPDMLIDSCSSGGRRNDLETLRRAVPLLRSDYTDEPVGQQNHTYGIALWMPYFGTGSHGIDSYVTRSALCPGYQSCLLDTDVRRKDLNYAEARRLLGQWRQFAPCYFGDYYPLTAYHPTNDVWMAWQFDRPEQGDGMVQAFRRAESPYESIRVKLRGLEPGARYTLTDLDADRPQQLSGRELGETGLLVTAPNRPSAIVILYKKVR